MRVYWIISRKNNIACLPDSNMLHPTRVQEPGQYPIPIPDLETQIEVLPEFPEYIEEPEEFEQIWEKHREMSMPGRGRNFTDEYNQKAFAYDLTIKEMKDQLEESIRYYLKILIVIEIKN